MRSRKRKVCQRPALRRHLHLRLLQARNRRVAGELYEYGWMGPPLSVQRYIVVAASVLAGYAMAVWVDHKYGHDNHGKVEQFYAPGTVLPSPQLPLRKSTLD